MRYNLKRPIKLAESYLRKFFPGQRCFLGCCEVTKRFVSFVKSHACLVAGFADFIDAHITGFILGKSSVSSVSGPCRYSHIFTPAIQPIPVDMIDRWGRGIQAQDKTMQQLRFEGATPSGVKIFTVFVAIQNVPFKFFYPLIVGVINNYKKTWEFITDDFYPHVRFLTQAVYAHE